MISFLMMGAAENNGNLSNQSGSENSGNGNSNIPIGFKVLIVDDDMDFLGALTFILRNRNIDVTAVNSGYEALTAIESNGFDLVLLDLKMPGMDGIETFKRIRKVKKGYYVVLMTAFHEKAHTDELIGKADGFLKKPFDFSDLREYIDRRKEG